MWKLPFGTVTATRRVSVALVGVGGTGSKVLTELVHLDAALRAHGFGGLDVTAFDPDTVSESNIVRQAFAPSDVGLPKAEVLINRINLYMGLDWSAVNERFAAGWARRSWNLVISAVDTGKARKGLHKAAFGTGLYTWNLWIDLGNTATTGQVVLGTPRSPGCELVHALPCATELFPELMEDSALDDDTPSCSAVEALQKQELFVNLWSATAAVGMLGQLLLRGEITHHATFFNLKSGQMHSRAVPEKPQRSATPEIGHAA